MYLKFFHLTKQVIRMKITNVNNPNRFKWVIHGKIYTCIVSSIFSLPKLLNSVRSHLLPAMKTSMCSMKIQSTPSVNSMIAILWSTIKCKINIQMIKVEIVLNTNLNKTKLGICIKILFLNHKKKFPIKNYISIIERFLIKPKYYHRRNKMIMNLLITK